MQLDIHSLCHNYPLIIIVPHLFSVWIVARNGWQCKLYHLNRVSKALIYSNVGAGCREKDNVVIWVQWQRSSSWELQSLVEGPCLGQRSLQGNQRRAHSRFLSFFPCWWSAGACTELEAQGWALAEAVCRWSSLSLPVPQSWESGSGKQRKAVSTLWFSLFASFMDSLSSLSPWHIDAL